MGVAIVTMTKTDDTGGGNTTNNDSASPNSLNGTEHHNRTMKHLVRIKKFEHLCIYSSQ